MPVVSMVSSLPKLRDLFERKDSTCDDFEFDTDDHQPEHDRPEADLFPIAKKASNRFFFTILSPKPFSYKNVHGAMPRGLDNLKDTLAISSARLAEYNKKESVA